MPFWDNEKGRNSAAERVDLGLSSPIIAPLPAPNGRKKLFISKV